MSEKFLKVELFFLLFAYFCRNIKRKNVSKRGGGASGKESKPTGSPHFTTAKTWLMNKLVVAENGMSPAKVFALQGIKLFYSRGAGATPCRYFYLARGYIKGYFWRAPFSLSSSSTAVIIMHYMAALKRQSETPYPLSLSYANQRFAPSVYFWIFFTSRSYLCLKELPIAFYCSGIHKFRTTLYRKNSNSSGPFEPKLGTHKTKRAARERRRCSSFTQMKDHSNRESPGSSNLFAYLISLAAAVSEIYSFALKLFF